jgi:Flp pilus assembly pilin Flp
MRPKAVLVWSRTALVGTSALRRHEPEIRLSQEPDMKAMKNLLSKLVKDEQGGEVLEYALITGLIIVAAIAVITTVGGKVLARWNAVDSCM